MKTILSILLLAITGCTTTTFKHTPNGGWTLARKSFLQKLEVPQLTINTNGTVSMSGYANDGGNQALAVAVSAAVTAAMKGATP